MRSLFALAVTVSLSACVYQETDPKELGFCPKYHEREIRLTTSLDIKWQAGILQAYGDWGELLKERYPYHIVISDEPPNGDPCVTSWQLNRNLKGYIAHVNEDNTVDVQKVVDNTVVKKSIAVHEVGHLLGLRHADPSINSIMKENVPIGGSLTCHDEWNLCDLWHCQVSKPCENNRW